MKNQLTLFVLFFSFFAVSGAYTHPHPKSKNVRYSSNKSIAEENKRIKREIARQSYLAKQERLRNYRLERENLKKEQEKLLRQKRYLIQKRRNLEHQKRTLIIEKQKI